MLLITGTPRSGTHYTARLLQALGLEVGHETVGRDGAVSWKHITTGTFEVNKKRRRRVQHIDSEGFTTVLHQVRHPLRTIASMQTLGEATWAYMAKFTSMTGDEPVLRRAMIAYLEWNRLIEKRAAWCFRIEHFEQVFPEFCRRLGLLEQPLPQLTVGARDSRTKRYSPVTWDDLARVDGDLAERVRRRAVVYGYGEDAAADSGVL